MSRMKDLDIERREAAREEELRTGLMFAELQVREIVTELKVLKTLLDTHLWRDSHYGEGPTRETLQSIREEIERITRRYS